MLIDLINAVVIFAKSPPSGETSTKQRHNQISTDVLVNRSRLSFSSIHVFKRTRDSDAPPLCNFNLPAIAIVNRSSTVLTDLMACITAWHPFGAFAPLYSLHFFAIKIAQISYFPQQDHYFRNLKVLVATSVLPLPVIGYSTCA